MSLPTEKTPKKEDFQLQSIMIYGNPKIGKSTFASNFPNAIFLATEPGLNNLEVFQIQIKTWQDLLKSLKELHNGDHNFNTIVIDTIDNAYKLCTEYVCKQNDIKHESELGFGRGYALIKQEFEKVITFTASMSYGILFISHATNKEVETRTGNKTIIIPTIHQRVREFILGLMDIILYCDIEYDTDKKANRVMRTKPSDLYTAGDRTGKLPATLSLNYNVFIKYFESQKDTKKDTVKKEQKDTLNLESKDTKKEKK